MEKTIDKKVIAERLNKFEGRHFRLLNRLASKNLEEKISTKSALKDVNEELEKYFKSNNEDLKGVSSAIYSKINHSIKDTRFSGANLGLVIEDNDVKTNYDVKDLKNFMKFLGVYNSNIFKKPFFGKRKIINSSVANGSTINKSMVAYSSTINKSKVANDSIIKDYSSVADKSIIENDSWVANISTIKNNSSVAKISTINNSNVAESSTIKNNSSVAKYAKVIKSYIGEDTTIKNNSSVAKYAKIRESYVGEEATKDSSSSIAENIKYI